MRWVTLGVLLVAGGCDMVFGLERPPPPPATPTIAAGTAHTCAIHADRTLWCWGENARSESGQPDTTAEILAPMQIGDARWITVAVGGAHSCAIDVDDNLWCWGVNELNAIGANTNVDHLLPTPVLENVTQVTVGSQHTCAIRRDATLWCWGNNQSGQLAITPTSSEAVPTHVAIDRTWRQVSAGFRHTCGITSNGELLCWGENDNSQVAINGVSEYAEPELIEPGTKWVDVALGTYHTCAVRANGTLRCWGYNAYGQLSANTDEVEVMPTFGRTWVRVFAKFLQTCAFQDDGSLWCFGDNAQHQLGLPGPDVTVKTPTEVLGGSGEWTDVALGTGHFCGMDSDGVIWCTGNDGSGQLGTGSGGGKLTPTQVEGSWRSPAVGGRSVCARIGSQDTLRCWGDNTVGQLGNGTIHPEQRPSFVLDGQIDSYYDVGDGHACTATGTSPRIVSCWGRNDSAQVGLAASYSSRNILPTATQIGSPREIAAGATHTCATNATRMFCWGSNRFGQLGQASDSLPHPIAVELAGVWTQIDAGFQHTCGVDSSGLKCWGDNTYGQRGTVTATGPSLVMSGVSSVALGNYHSCLLETTESRLRCWGRNGEGQLGDDTTTNRSSPVPIGTAVWSAITAGFRHTCGIQTTVPGTLWCWGDNARGQLGDGTRTSRRTPTRIGSDADWKSVAAGGQETCAIKNDNTLWCWGANDAGQIGDGSAWSAKFTSVSLDR